MLHKNLILILLICILGCTNYPSILDNKNYKRAYKLSLKNLEKNQSDNKSREILKAALEGILEESTKKKEVLILSSKLTDKEKALKINKNLQKQIAKTVPFLGSFFETDTQKLQEEEKDLSQGLRTEYFKLGVENLSLAKQTKIKEKAQLAHNNFVKAKNYGSQKTSIDSLLKESIKLDTLIYTVKADASFEIMSNWDIDRQFSNIDDYNSKFRKIYYEPISSPKADCHIEIRFNSLLIDTEESLDEKVFTATKVTGKEIRINSEGEEEEVPICEEVEGKVIIKQITKTAEWSTSVSISSNGQNCDLLNTMLSEKVSSEITEIAMEGDTDVIPDEYKDTRKEELKSDDDMTKQLIELLYEKVTNHLF